MLAIIDGDVLCHLACKSRWESRVKIALDKDNKQVTFVELDENGKRKELEYTKAENEKYLKECWNNFNKHLDSIKDLTYSNDFLMAVKGVDNYRHLIDPEYKSHRKKDPSKQNIFIPVLRQLAIAEDIAVAADGFEADDLIRIWAEECNQYNIPFTIFSIDKDLLCIPGKHWDLKKNILIEISEEEAMRHYYEQLLKGDPTDNIKGVLNIGEVKAKNILANCKTEEDFQEKVVEQYMLCYQDEWYLLLLINGRLLHIKKSYNDFFNPRNWACIRGLSDYSYLP